MTMRSNRFEYFLNAVHYGIWLYQKKMGDKIDRQWSSFIRILTKYFPEKWRNKILACDELSKKETLQFYNDRQNGVHIQWATAKFGLFYSCYPAFLSFVLLGIYIKASDHLNSLVALCFLSIILIAYIPAYWAVFLHDIYLQYFKKFEKNDEVWHKKWSRITMSFCGGGAVMAVMGLVIATLILQWQYIFR